MKISIIMIIAMFAIFLTFAIYGMITLDLSIEELKKLLGTRNESFSFNMMQDLDENVAKRLENFIELTKLQVVQDVLKKSNEQFMQVDDIELLLAQQERVSLTDKEPFPQIIGTEDELESRLIDVKKFYEEAYDTDILEELFITNEFGANIALGSGTSDYRQDDEEWWQITKNNGIFIGPLEYNEDYNSNVIAFGLRIDDVEGNFLGVMRVVLTLDDMIRTVVNDAEILNNPNRNVVLLDDNGVIVYSEGVQDFENNLPVSYFNEIDLEKNVGTIELTDELNEVRLVSYAKSTGFLTFPGFGWTVLVEQTRDSFVAEFVDLRNSILTISMIGMISSVLIGLVVSFVITNPLKEMSKLVKLVSEGNFNFKVKQSKIDEINVIGESFNKMSDSLKKLIETEKQLAEAQARVKNERLFAIGELASSMAHNMKNPLATIRSSADIIKRTSVGSDHEINQVLQRMDRAISRMSHQIEDVLNFVRITPMALNKTKINSILNSAIKSMDIPNNVSIDLEKTDIEVKCDSRKIESVFINLILNAIQAIDKNQGKITIRTKKENGFVVIEFEDTGPGIPEKIIDDIFDPLVTTKERGTGLGLSSCKNIIEQHGGSISAKNNPTIFTVKLPLDKE
ncbi:MAG TPA: ATP-binding protein [Nitrosopumilaceae archaeon]|nr:ATP-binding protein [Nitrosopumilaceae archaeon]